MKHAKKILFYLLMAAVAYFGYFNNNVPAAIFLSILAFGVFVALWILKPLVIYPKLSYDLKHADYFNIRKLFEMFMSTFLIIQGVIGIEISGGSHTLSLSFLILKIVVGIILEAAFFMVTYREGIYPLD